MFRPAVVVVVGVLLAGCAEIGPPPSFALPLTRMVVPSPDFAHAKFVTTAEVALLSGQESETVIADLPEGTPVVPVGVVGSEAPSWEVATPAGNGWVYTRYLAPRWPADE